MHRPRVLLGWQVALAVALAAAGEAHAFQCVSKWGSQAEAEKQFAEASAVVVARIQELGDRLDNGFSWDQQQIVRLKVERQFKGGLGGDVRITVPAHLPLGERLLLFVHPNPPEERLAQTRGRWAWRQFVKAEALAAAANGRRSELEKSNRMNDEGRRADELVTTVDADIPLLSAGGVCSRSVYRLSNDPAKSPGARTALPPAMGMSGDDILWLLETTPAAGSSGQAWLTVDVENPFGDILSQQAMAAPLRAEEAKPGDALTLRGPEGVRRLRIQWPKAGEPRPPLTPTALPPGLYQIELPELPGYKLNCWRVTIADDCHSFLVGDGSVVQRAFFYRPAAWLSVALTQSDGRMVYAAGLIRVRRLSPWPAGLPFQPAGVAVDTFEQRGRFSTPGAEQPKGALFTLPPGRYAVDLVLPKLAPSAAGEAASARRVASVVALPLRGGESVETTAKGVRFTAPVPAALKPARLKIRVPGCADGSLGVEMLTTVQPGELAVAQGAAMSRLSEQCEYVHNGYIGQTVQVRFDPRWNETLLAGWVELNSSDTVIELERSPTPRWRLLAESAIDRR